MENAVKIHNLIPISAWSNKREKNCINRMIYFIGVYCMNSLKDAGFDFLSDLYIYFLTSCSPFNTIQYPHRIGSVFQYIVLKNRVLLVFLLYSHYYHTHHTLTLLVVKREGSPTLISSELVSYNLT